MLAMVLNQAGAADTFIPVNRPIPMVIKTKSVLKIQAFGLNRAEVITRSGGSPDVLFPRVIGIEAVGTIYATNPNSGFSVGETVITLMGGLGREFDGSYEEYALVPNQQLYTVQTTMSWAELATIPESFYTAYGSLKKLGVTSGDHLLIRGGSSTVGIAALLLAKQLGLRVATTTRDPAKRAVLNQLGADQVIIDNGQLAIHELFDEVLELVGVATLRNTFNYVNPRTGRVVITGGLGGAWEFNKFSPFEIVGSLGNFQSTVVQPNDLRKMLQLVSENNLKMPIQQTFKLCQVGAAHQLLEHSQARIGKIVIVN